MVVWRESADSGRTFMILIWAGLAAILLKLLAIGPFGELSWWWTLSPFVLALLWFEVLEKPLGFHRRSSAHTEIEKRRKARVAEQFPKQPPGPRK